MQYSIYRATLLWTGPSLGGPIGVAARPDVRPFQCPVRARKSRPESCIKFKVPDILLVALFKAKSQGQGHAVHWRRTAAEDRDKF